MNQRFQSLPAIVSDVEAEWKLFKLGLLASATEACGTKYMGSALGGQLRTSWWTPEVQQFVKEKKLAFKVWLNDKSEANRQLYLICRKTASDVVKKAKDQSWSTFGEQMESNYWNANKVFWQTVRRMRNQKKGTINVVKGRDGQLLNDDCEILRRWKEYFEELYNPISGPEVSPIEESNEESVSDLSAEELSDAIKSLKSGKAAGIDEIRPEMLKSMGEKGMQWLLRVCRTAWRTGNTPEDWRTGVVVPLYKKGDHKDCNNYRGITLLSLPGKAYAKVLEKRCKPIVETRIQEEQCGFRAGRSTTDNCLLSINC